MGRIIYKEEDDAFYIKFTGLFQREEYVEIHFAPEKLQVIKNGKENVFTLNEITDLIYTTNQSSPPRNPYSRVEIVTGEIYFKSENDPVELVTFTSIESAELLLRDTQVFKIVELLAIKLSKYYKISTIYKYEIDTKAKSRGVSLALGVIVIMWALVFLLIFTHRK